MISDVGTVFAVVVPVGVNERLLVRLIVRLVARQVGDGNDDGRPTGRRIRIQAAQVAVDRAHGRATTVAPHRHRRAIGHDQGALAARSG